MEVFIASVLLFASFQHFFSAVKFRAGFYSADYANIILPVLFDANLALNYLVCLTII